MAGTLTIQVLGDNPGFHKEALQVAVKAIQAMRPDGEDLVLAGDVLPGDRADDVVDAEVGEGPTTVEIPRDPTLLRTVVLALEARREKGWEDGRTAVFIAPIAAALAVFEPLQEQAAEIARLERIVGALAQGELLQLAGERDVTILRHAGGGTYEVFIDHGRPAGVRQTPAQAVALAVLGDHPPGA